LFFCVFFEVVIFVIFSFLVSFFSQKKLLLSGFITEQVGIFFRQSGQQRAFKTLFVYAGALFGFIIYIGKPQ
jgi:hypothetical protein